MWKSSKGNYPDDADRGRGSHSSRYGSSRGYENSNYERDNNNRYNRMSNTNKRDAYGSYRGSSRDRSGYSHTKRHNEGSVGHNRKHNETSGTQNRQYNKPRPYDGNSDHSQDDGRHNRKRRHHDEDHPRVHNKSQHIDKDKRQNRYESPYRRSPRTPQSVSPRRRRYSPPMPPFEPPKTGDSSNRSEVVPTPTVDFNKFAESKRPETKDSGPDPRLSEPLYGTRIVTKFDVVAFPRNANIDTSLDSPPFTLDMDSDSIYTHCSFLQTPLERINGHLAFSRPKIEQEWWLKGTLSLLIIGIPRHWGAMDSLSHIVDSYTRINELPEESFTETYPKSTKELCTELGIKKFILLFGETGLAVNNVPANYPRVDPTDSRRLVQNEQPEGMALAIFETEEMALKFWSVLSGTLIQAYPSSIRVCPDPSGWRIYSEALSLFFQNEHLVTTVNPQQPKDESSLDLLSVLTKPNLSPDNTSPASKSDTKNTTQKLQARLTFVCSYISNQEDANAVAKALSKHGIKCMYHKLSKIMSLQFPDDKTLQSISFCHKTFTTPSGSRAQCCFIKCDGKAIPIIKRASVEHISNSIDKKKNSAPKPLKFQPPQVGIISFDEF